MPMERRYDSGTAEPRLAARWEDEGLYRFDRESEAPVYSIDTPPPTASGVLHLGHVYSYSQADFFARFHRMNGANVYYPMGYDDNGLPTERLVERRLGVKAREIGRTAFIHRCLELSVELEREYEALWRRLGLSVDWRYTYRTIDDRSRRISQASFIDLVEKRLAYRRRAPAIWCPECETAIAQAEENDVERRGEYLTLPFLLENGAVLPIATTRPELLAACVAVFVHPGDRRFDGLAGQTAQLPVFDRAVPILEDLRADPEKGTGAVMCCTFGDTTDVEWWYQHRLPSIEVLDRTGRLTDVAGSLAGLSVPEARERIGEELEARGLLLGREPTQGTIRVHERCDTPVEYIVTPQWFISVLAARDRFLETGAAVRWHPPHMEVRYREWVENMHWDWLISRQRAFGVPFPLWYCGACGEVRLADPDTLPVDPTETTPDGPCACGAESWEPEGDVMDTWATSSMSPQIAGRLDDDPVVYAKVYPYSLRPQAHEIIRTWAFDTIVKSRYNFDAVPWSDVLISGWGLAPEGAGKISKSRGGGPMAPMAMLERYSADAARYWAASTGPGKDAIISEERIAAGAKLVTKLWNVARLAERFPPPDVSTVPAGMTTADRWALSRLQRLIGEATDAFRLYDYLAAKNEVEQYFWTVLTDNYLEMAKGRLYDAVVPGHAAACWTVHTVLRAVVTLFAPILPFVCDEIYRGMAGDGRSVHRDSWPTPDDRLRDDLAERLGGPMLVDLATQVRRFKSETALSLGAPLARVAVTAPDLPSRELLQAGAADIASVTRAATVDVLEALPAGDGVVELVTGETTVGVAVMVG